MKRTEVRTNQRLLSVRLMDDLSLVLGLVLAFALLQPVSVAGQTGSEREQYDRYQALYQKYTDAIQKKTDKAALEKLAAELQAARPASLQTTHQTPVQTPPQATANSAPATSLPKIRSAEELAYDKLVARIYAPDRLPKGSTLIQEIKNFLQTARNPYFVQQATFELAELSFNLTRDPAAPKAILETYAQQAANPESRRIAKAKMAVYAQEKRIEEAKTAFSQKNQVAVAAWTKAYKTPWLAFPVKLAQLTNYFFQNLKRRNESRKVQELIEEYDRLVAQTFPTGTLDAFTHSKLLPCNDVTLLVNGRTSFARRFALASAARDKIYVQTLLYHNDEIGNQLADILIERAKAGVDCRVIVDDAFATGRKTNILRKLENGGVKVLINNPILENPLQFNFRSHQKIFLIDEEVAVVGGMNLANEYAKGEIEEYGWRDTDAEVRGPVVAEIADLFYRNWEILNLKKPWAIGQKDPQPVKELIEKLPILPHREKLIPGPLPIYFQEPPTFTNVRLRFLKTFPLESKDDDVLDLYASYMSVAKQEVIFESAYFIPTPELKEAILKACRRGVKVKILTNSVESNNHPTAGWAGRANYEEVLKGGAEIYEWRGSQTVHSKVCYFDGLAATFGSYNLNSRSHSSDAEDIFGIEDSRFSAALKKVLTIDLSRCKRITQQDVDGWRNNFSENLQMNFFNTFKGFF